MIVSTKNVEAGLKELGISDKRVTEAIKLWKQSIEGGMSHKAAAEKALKFGSANLRKDKEVRLQQARKTAGLTVGSRAKSVAAPFTSRVTKTTGSVKKRRIEKKTKKEAYEDTTEEAKPWVVFVTSGFIGLVVGAMVGAAVGFILALMYREILGNHAAGDLVSTLAIIFLAISGLAAGVLSARSQLVKRSQKHLSTEECTTKSATKLAATPA